VDWLETRGRLNDGFENEYARGLTVTSHKGLREVSHGGSTAGYQTYLARFPEARLSVAVLCNTTGTNPAAMAHQVADLFLAGRLKPEPARPTVTVADDVLQSRAGWYANPVSGALIPIVFSNGGLHVDGASGPKLNPIGPTEFALGRSIYRFESAATNGTTAGRVIETPGNTRPTTWMKVEPVTPSAQALKEYEGRFTSPELEVTYRVYEQEGKLWLRLHGEPPEELRPADRDRFESDGNVVRFTRDGAGRVDGFTVYAGRVWHLRFDRERR
jgi:YD repeat-containing protein